MPIETRELPINFIKVMVTYKCDECGEGQYIFDGLFFKSFYPQVAHKCNLCGDKKILDRKYPYTKRIVKE